MTIPYEFLMGTNGPASIEIKRAVINLAATGTVVAAVTGRKIRVLQAVFASAAVVTVTVKSASTALTGAMTVDGTAAGPVVLDFSPVGWWETTAGEALVFTLGSSVQVSGNLVYIEI